jgi:hypothetical protein
MPVVFAHAIGHGKMLCWAAIRRGANPPQHSCLCSNLMKGFAPPGRRQEKPKKEKS